MPDHPWMERLQATANAHSMTITIEKRWRRITAQRTGPGFPPRLTATASRDTPGSWNAAAKRLHDAITAGAVPDGL